MSQALVAPDHIDITAIPTQHRSGQAHLLTVGAQEDTLEEFFSKLAVSLIVGLFAAGLTTGIAVLFNNTFSSASSWISAAGCLAFIATLIIEETLYARNKNRTSTEETMLRLWQQRPHATTQPPRADIPTFALQTVAVNNDLYAYIIMFTMNNNSRKRRPSFSWQVLEAYQLDYVMAADQVAELQLHAEELEETAATTILATQQHQQDLQATARALQPSTGQ